MRKIRKFAAPVFDRVLLLLKRTNNLEQTTRETREGFRTRSEDSEIYYVKPKWRNTGSKRRRRRVAALSGVYTTAPNAAVRSSA